MINLIPPQCKTLVKKEYLFRVSAVASIIIACALFASAIALLPAYVLLGAHVGSMTKINEESVQKNAEYIRATEELEKTALLVAQLAKGTHPVSPTEVLIHIEQALSSEVALEGISLSLDATKIQVQARGTAKSRESLRLFLETLKKDTFFADAQVPVSDLARDKNLIFTLTLTLKTAS